MLAAAAITVSMSTVTASAAEKDVYLTRSKVNIEVGETQTIRLAGASGTIRWQITDSDVFKYSKGKITAVGEGSAYLYAINNGKKYKCLVTVENEPEGIAASESAISLDNGENTKVTVYTDGKSVIARSSNSKVCSLSCGVIVDDKFPLTIKAKSSGSCTITIYNKNKPSEKYDIKVTVGDSGSISVNGSSFSNGSSEAALSESEYIDEVIRLVNVERESAGLDPLKKNDSLCDAAAVRVGEIRTKFSHTRPDGTACFTAVEENGYKGENIALGYPSPEDVMTGWMNSSGHKANILDPGFTEIGVGYSDNGNYWVQVFLG